MLGIIQWEQHGVIRFEAQIIGGVEREEKLRVEYENRDEKIEGVLELTLNTPPAASASFRYRYDGRFDGTADAEGTLEKTVERIAFRGLWRVPGTGPCTWRVHCEYIRRPTIPGE